MNPPSSLNIDKDIFDICDILSSHKADKTTTSDIKCPVCAVYYPGKHIQVSDLLSFYGSVLIAHSSY